MAKEYLFGFEITTDPSGFTKATRPGVDGLTIPPGNNLRATLAYYIFMVVTVHDLRRHAGGRPSKYLPEYCQQIIEFFTRENNREVILHKRFGAGKNETDVEVDVKLIPGDLPTMEGFANKLETTTTTLNNWTKEYPEFLAAVTRAKQLQKEMLVVNGLNHSYSSPFAQFVAKNLTDMVDKSEVEEHHKGGITVKTIQYAATEQKPK